MLWIFLLIVVGAIIFNFFSSMEKDKSELRLQPLPEKFAYVVTKLNDVVFHGLAEVQIISDREFNLYDGSNQIICFQYSTGSLTLVWRYKYFQKEVAHQKNFPNSRNLSIFEQEKIADTMITEVKSVILNHQKDVLGM